MDIKERIEFLIKKAKFELTDEEKVRFEEDLLKFKENLKLFEDFDLSNVQPSRLPFEDYKESLREDDHIVNNNEYILKNASKTEKEYIVLEDKK